MIGKMRNALILAALLAAAAQPAAAQGTGALTSKIELEKSTPASGGQPARKAYVAPDVVVICPLLSGPKLMIFWITKETWNAEQEASPGRDYRQAA